MPELNATHDPKLTSWVESANDGRTDFPIQNLPFAIFRRQGSQEAWRGGVAIGDQIVDLAGSVQAGAFSGNARAAAQAATEPTLNRLMGLGATASSALRQALSIAVDIEEMISIFSNGRGLPAQGPIPPGIFGHQAGRAGINPVVYDWVDGRAVRKPLAAAQALMIEAGYPDGRHPDTGKPLTLYFDAFAFGPDYKPLFNWYRKQFAKLGIQLVVRMTDYNRFQDKVRTGAAQIFGWGWNADYPDPENFLFLFYGPHGKVKHHGENASNYASAAFDRDYLAMRGLPNGPARQAVIDRMLDRVRRDAPWIWGTHPQAYSLFHAWYANGKANMMARNTLKYRRLDPAQRATLRAAWNTPVLWPLDEMADRWDGCVLRAWVDGRLYQEVPVAAFLRPEEMLRIVRARAPGLAAGNLLVFGGTIVSLDKRLGFGRHWAFELEDREAGRRIRHGYDVIDLTEEVAPGFRVPILNPVPA